MSFKFSPSTLVNYYKCPYESFVKKYLLLDSNYAKPDKEDPFETIIANKGISHEAKILEELKSQYNLVGEINSKDRNEALEMTLSFIEKGYDVIFQAAFSNNHFFGYSDFLIKSTGACKFGPYSYEIWDAKLAKTVRPEHVIQLCCYADMICETIECELPLGVIFTGKKEKVQFNLHDYFSFYSSLRDLYLQFESSEITAPPNPENYTNWGNYSEHAKALLESKGHLSQIANIKKTQIQKLQESGIHTIKQLIAKDSVRPQGMDISKFESIKRQARLQQESKDEKTLKHEVINLTETQIGLATLPPKDKSDIYFDLESNPINKDFVLHYLWGVAHEDDDSRFKSWWVHDLDEMREVFENFIDWVYERWLRNPNMHIYHYGQFEVSVMRELMGKFGTRETQVDNLLRNNAFIDLFKIISHGLVVGAEGYGLKKIEPLFREHRIDEVQSGQESTVQYEMWLESDEGRDETSSSILKEIWDYNREDCISLIDLCDFLRTQQKENNIQYVSPISEERINEPDDIEILLNDLLANIDKDERTHAELLANLCLYHKRENKPAWWRLFDRLESSDEELVDDLDSLGNLTFTGRTEAIKRSTGYEYKFDPNQDSKLKTGDQARVKQDSEISVTIHDLDLKKGICILKTTKPSLPKQLSLISFDLVAAPNIEANIKDIATKYIETGYLKPCIKNLLDRSRPYTSKEGPKDFSKWGDNLVDIAINVTSGLNEGSLCIQGPPGTGKTYIGAKVIADLASKGFKVGVTSNSHKAIDNLIERVLANINEESHISICRINKTNESFYEESDLIDHYASTSRVNFSKDYKIYGGTPWALAHESFNDHLDYLFVDEAGQVSLANLIGISASCKNIILMGDQMQLSQPAMGSHPANAGSSSLEYVLEGNATIPKDRGIFLTETYRLHPDICDFISHKIYEDRLHAAPANEKRTLISPQDSLIKPSGIQYIPLDHEGNEQASPEEVEAIKDIINQLLSSRLFDGIEERAITKKDILIVSPFNHQIRNLQDALGDEIQIGTVDKFQGREAPVVIFSMASSDIESTPRGANFLFEKNRLNVAITRAQSLAIIVASRGLERTDSYNIKEIKDISFYLDIIANGRKPFKQYG